MVLMWSDRCSTFFAPSLWSIWRRQVQSLFLDPNLVWDAQPSPDSCYGGGAVVLVRKFGRQHLQPSTIYFRGITAMEGEMLQFHTHHFPCLLFNIISEVTNDPLYHLTIMQLQIPELEHISYATWVGGIIVAATLISVLRSDSPKVSGTSISRLLFWRSWISWTISQQLDRILGWDRGGPVSSFWSMLPTLSKKVTKKYVRPLRFLSCWHSWWLQYKGTPFKVSTFYHWMVIVSGRQYVEEFRKSRDDELNFLEAAGDVIICFISSGSSWQIRDRF